MVQDMFDPEYYVADLVISTKAQKSSVSSAYLNLPASSSQPGPTSGWTRPPWLTVSWGRPGVKNLTSLGSLITWQKLEYDFQFQKLEYDADIPCLVMSEGRSMLPSDIQLMVKPGSVEARPDLISKTFGEIGAGLDSDLLDRLRRYITTARFATFDLTEQVMRAVQDDFVTMRQTEQGISVEAFHSLLVLGRLSE